MPRGETGAAVSHIICSQPTSESRLPQVGEPNYQRLLEGRLYLSGQGRGGFISQSERLKLTQLSGMTNFQAPAKFRAIFTLSFYISKRRGRCGMDH